MPIEVVTGEAAAANVAGQPINLMLYGPPGTLKTTDAVNAFSRPFFIGCEDNALKIVASRGMTVPAHVKQTVKSWGQMYEAFSWLGQNRQHFTALIIDGFSPFTNYIYKEAEEGFKGNKNKFAIPMYVRSCLLAMREWIRQLGLHCVLVAHPLPPVFQDGVFYPGGFSMSPKTLVGDFFGQTDTVLRVDHLQMGIGQAPVRVYYTGGTEWPAELATVMQPPDWRQWRTKNRDGYSAAVVPADLRAYLRGRQGPPYVGL